MGARVPLVAASDASPVQIAAMACSRTPKRMYLPSGVAAWKSSAPFGFVRLEGVRSAEPPTSSGMPSASLFRTTWLDWRVASALSSGVHLVLGGGAASMRRGRVVGGVWAQARPVGSSV